MTAPLNRQAAVNRLIAAAIAHRESLRLGQGPSRQQALIDAVDTYLCARSGTDAVRDAFLVEYPTADDLQAAVTAHRRRSEPAPQDPPSRPSNGMIEGTH